MIFLLFFIIFFSYTFGLMKSGKVEPEVDTDDTQSLSQSTLLVVLGLIGLGVGAEMLVGSAKSIAESF